MYGFAQDALVLFPDYKLLANADYRLKANLRVAIEKVFNYLKSRGMTPKAFITDDIARYYSDVGFAWVSTLAPGDLYFMSANVDMASNVMRLQADTYPEVYDKVNAKFPYPDGVSIEQRFDIMCDRDKHAAKAIIPMYKVIVHFYHRGAVKYNVTSKPGDERIRIIIDIKNFSCTPYFGGCKEDAIELLGANFASRSVLHWEV